MWTSVSPWLWVYARALPFCEIAARYRVTATAISTAAEAVPLPLPTPAGGLNMTLSLWVYPNTETGSPQVIASTATVAGVRSASMVGPGIHCSPRHSTHPEPSFLVVHPMTRRAKRNICQAWSPPLHRRAF